MPSSYCRKELIRNPIISSNLSFGVILKGKKLFVVNIQIKRGKTIKFNFSSKITFTA